MTNKNSTFDDEINIFHLVEVIWADKFVIIIFTLVSFLSAIGFINIKDPVYESKINFYPKNIPPYLNANRVNEDFKYFFYDKKNFQNWKNNSTNVSITFELFSQTKILEGFEIQKEDRELIVKTLKNFIIIKSNKLDKLNDIFLYSKYINDIMKAEYLIRANNELKFMEQRIKEFAPEVSSQSISQLLLIERYLLLLEKGNDVFEIKRPLKPKKISIQNSFIILISLIIGVTIGTFFVLIRSSFRTYKRK